MQDADLFIGLAGIAGVFVGFGALIAARSGGPSEAMEVAPMRMVVMLGMMAIVAALAPVTLARYGPTGHQVWALSSAVVVLSWLVVFVANSRTPEWREGWAMSTAPARAGRLGAFEAIEWVVYVFYMLASLLTPIVIVLGLAPDLEAALYFTVVVLILLGAGWALLGLVFMPRRPVGA
jgi:hypothetical protein